jgi:hypothetical protein
MVVGAPNIDAAYIFRRSDTGVWRQRQTLVASELARGFGTAVAIDRAMIIVGAPFVGEGESSPKGAAYGFTPGGGIYVETFKLQPRPDEVSDYVYFGRQIAMFDQRIVIGAQLLITDAPLNGVIVFTYTRAGSSVMARGVVGGAFASTSLSLANQRLLVGVPCSTSIQGLCLGKVDLYSLNVFE